MKPSLKTLATLKLWHGGIPNKEGENLFGRDFLLKPDISPYLVYSVLKDHFGLPNSPDFDDDKTQWAWFFSYEDFHVEIYDYRLESSSIGVYHRDSDACKSEQLANKINKLLLEAASKKTATVKAAIKRSKHKLLQNPYATYYSTAENLIALSSVIRQMGSVGKFAHFVQDDEAAEGGDSISLWDKQADLYKSAFLMFLSSFEGFLNILYELYLRAELRGDRLGDRISREQIDIKLRIAPIYCDGFKTKVIDNEDVRFKNYLRLVSLRNDYVHANLIRSLERYFVTEDDYSFLIENEDNGEIPSNINELELEHVLLAQHYVDEVVDLVIESMEPKTRREFKSIIFKGEIEVEDEDGVLIPR